MSRFLDNFGAISNLILLIVSAGVLFWFLYWFLLRRLVRARRIANLRERRMLREAAERESSRN